MAGSVLKGVVGISGVVVGRAWLFRGDTDGAGEEERDALTNDAAEAWEEARSRVDAALARLAEQARDDLLTETAEILEAQRAMLADPALAQRVEAAVAEGKDVVTATQFAVGELAKMLEQVGSEYVSQRANDIREVGRALQVALRGRDPYPLASIPPNSIICARTLGAGELAAIPRKNLAGLALEQGGATSHVAIMARTMGIPAVLGVKGLLDTVSWGEEMLLEGSKALVLVQPTEEERQRHLRTLELQEREARQLVSLRQLPAETADGYRVALLANIGGPQDVRHAIEAGAEGVGLFRTEFLVVDRPSWPSEEEQVRHYRQVLEAMGGRPMIFRTFDIGGDKPVPMPDLPTEANPFLGSRAIRWSLARPDVLREQFRAMLRAAGETGAEPWIMVPMVTVLEEVIETRRHLEAIVAEVNARWGWEQKPRLGVMVETPAAALNATALAREVDFFSIGSNDLVQYTMAVDRTNEYVAGLYQTAHPAVLRLIAEAARAARRAGIPCGVCGEMAGDERLVPLLVGMGVTELSMSAGSLARVKACIRTIKAADAQALAEQALQCGTAQEVDELLQVWRCDAQGDSR